VPLVVYFDEVGNPTLDASDKDFPVFAIALFIVDETCYVDDIVPKVNHLKFKLAGHEGVILHSRDIRKAQHDFGFLTDPKKKAAFYDSINEIMSSCDYRIIPVAIQKERHIAQYRYPANPYDLALLFALERLLSVLEYAGQTQVIIVAENRGKHEDRELYTSFQRIVSSGSEFVDGARFRAINWTLRFLPKSMNIIGTQLADLAAYPIARHVLDPTKPNPAFDIVRRKFCRALKIFP
jgi:hypothetical protein